MIVLTDSVTLGSAQTRSLSPVPQGLKPPVSLVSAIWKRAIPFGIAPSETSRRSRRTPALLYPPGW